MSYEYLLKPVRNTLLPPANVRGMKILDKEKFRKPLKIFTLLCPKTLLPVVIPKLKPFILKLEKLKPIRIPESIPETIVERSKDNPLLQNMREIIFNPLKIDSWYNLPVKFLEDKNILPEYFSFDEIELSYDNWGAAIILRSVLPIKMDTFKSFSCVGHIVHVNLRQNLLPFKQIIGQVIFDKVPKCRTVLNKSSVISNTYRFFEFELLCGEPFYEVETKENGYRYKLDFSSVYWNPRLSTEHQRICNMISSHDVLYDVFAGIGPFAVPAADKGATVYANDLNPECLRWLQHNIDLNTKNSDAKCFNMDGAKFIRDIIKPDLIERWRAQSPIISLGYDMYIVMNLPETAINFLSEFRGLFEDVADQIHIDLPEFKFPNIFFYIFAKGDIYEAENYIRSNLRQVLRMPLGNIMKDLQFVRNVAPKNNMYRVHLLANKTLLTTSNAIPMKRIIGNIGDIPTYTVSEDLESEIEISSDQQQQQSLQSHREQEVKKEEEEDKQENSDTQQQQHDEQKKKVIDNDDNEFSKLGKRSNPSPSDDDNDGNNMIIGDQIQVKVDIEEAKKPKTSSPSMENLTNI